MIECICIMILMFLWLITVLFEFLKKIHPTFSFFIFFPLLLCWVGIHCGIYHPVLAFITLLQNFIMYYDFFFFLVIVGFELNASYLLGRCSTHPPFQTRLRVALNSWSSCLSFPRLRLQMSGYATTHIPRIPFCCLVPLF
jgi:hypothetical protein